MKSQSRWPRRNSVESSTNQQRRRILLAGLAATPLLNARLGAAEPKPGGPRTLTFEVEAKPSPIALDASKTGVMVVDMQNDFGSPGGMFNRVGIDISGIRGAIAPTANVLVSARRASLPIIYLKMAFRPDLSDLGPPDSPNRMRHLQMGVGKEARAPDGRLSRVLIRDTWNTDILAELRPDPADIVIYKHRYSGFFGTGLDAELKRRGIRNLIFTGCTTSVCVDGTLRDAMYRDYSCVLLTDCMSQPALPNSHPGALHDSTLAVTEALLGWTSTSDQFVAALSHG
jgi:ureidoacrylate peracid hydrolase